MDEKELFRLPITIYGNITQYSKTISRARCRIFYKYENRNGTYITDEFADKLLSTISYTPIKGIYEGDEGDYTDHGLSRTMGKIYGIVPENPNLQWETHLDEDNVSRTYACVDVLLFTALYDEAAEITGKAQSMELYPPSISGEWIIQNGKKLFRFTDACFLGLQVLGDNVEPCFEGAAFFELYDSVKKMIEEIEAFELKVAKIDEGGKIKMPKINFKLSDSQKHDTIWDLVNTNYTEESDWAVDYAVINNNESALCYNYNTASFERVVLKENEDGSCSIGEREPVFVVDMTESEKNSLEALYTRNNNTYENINEMFISVEDFNLKIGELESNISTLETEKNDTFAQLEAANATIETLNAELSGLKEFKKTIEDAEKSEIINSYTNLLDDEIISSYREKINEYDSTSLDKELAYELKKSNVEIFTKDSKPALVPKDEPKGGIEELLAKFE